MKIVSVLVLGMVALSACVTGASAGESRYGEKSRDNKTTTLFRVLGKNAVWNAGADRQHEFPDLPQSGTGALALTHNAFWLGPLDKQSLRGYFMTESDNQAELVIYDVTLWINRN